MTDAVETTEEVEADQVDEAEEVESDETDQVEDPTAGLQKALKAERLARRESDKKAKALEQQLADKDKPADELAIEAARREAREEAQAAANKRIALLEVKSALAGRVSNTAAALKLIDTSAIEVDGDGEVDADAIEAAIATLLAETPELAVKQQRFQGGADQGSKGRDSKPSQMTRAEFDQIKSNPHAVEKARVEGRLNKLLGVDS